MNFVEYIKATQVEMTHVNWPTRAQTFRFTAAVVGISLILSILLGISDFVFTRLLTLLFH